MTATTTAPLEWAELWAAMDADPDAWIPTTEAMYWTMLEVVPPRCQERNRFLVGEPQSLNERGEDVHACFKEVGTEFYAKHMTVQEFKS